MVVVDVVVAAMGAGEMEEERRTATALDEVGWLVGRLVGELGSGYGRPRAST